MKFFIQSGILPACDHLYPLIPGGIMSFTKICMAVVACMTLSSAVLAQVRPGYDGRNLERRVSDLEQEADQMSRRLIRLERALEGNRPPVYQEREDISCLLIDSGYMKTFFAEGRTKLEAETNVRQACAKSVHSSYCNGSALKCSSGVKEYGVRGYLCVVTDSGYGKIFKAEGKNEVEAEAKAKQACQNSVHASYCGNVKAHCESF